MVRMGLVKIFLLGIVITSLSFVLYDAPLEMPTGLDNAEIISPKDRISEDQIHVYKDGIKFDIKNASWAKFTDTNSMDPFLDQGANSIEVKPKNPDDVHVGDVISYQTLEGLIVHRVIEKGQDEKGIFYKTKGDNNKIKDPHKIRFDQINGVLVAVIY